MHVEQLLLGGCKHVKAGISVLAQSIVVKLWSPMLLDMVDMVQVSKTLNPNPQSLYQH
jgi:hypothetical protein